MIIRNVPVTLSMAGTVAARTSIQMSDPQLGMNTTDSKGRTRLVSLDRSYTLASSAAEQRDETDELRAARVGRGPCSFSRCTAT